MFVQKIPHAARSRAIHCIDCHINVKNANKVNDNANENNNTNISKKNNNTSNNSTFINVVKWNDTGS